MAVNNISWRSSIGRGKGQHEVTYKSDGSITKTLEDLEEPYTLRFIAKCSDVDSLRDLEKALAGKISELGGQKLLTDFDD